jgi:hypothetical protein
MFSTVTVTTASPNRPRRAPAAQLRHKAKSRADIGGTSEKRAIIK